MEQSNGARWVAMVLLMVGIVLLGVSLLLVANRSSYAPEAWPLESVSADAAVAQARLLLRVVLLLGLVFLIFALGCLAMSRWSRRMHASLSGRTSKPTSSEDVWQMHRLPDDQDES